MVQENRAQFSPAPAPAPRREPEQPIKREGPVSGVVAGSTTGAEKPPRAAGATAGPSPGVTPRAPEAGAGGPSRRPVPEVVKRVVTKEEEGRKPGSTLSGGRSEYPACFLSFAPLKTERVCAEPAHLLFE